MGRMSIFNILAAHNPDSQPKQLTGAYFPDESATSRELRVAGGEVGSGSRPGVDNQLAVKGKVIPHVILIVTA